MRQSWAACRARLQPEWSLRIGLDSCFSNFGICRVAYSAIYGSFQVQLQCAALVGRETGAIRVGAVRAPRLQPPGSRAGLDLPVKLQMPGKARRRPERRRLRPRLAHDTRWCFRGCSATAKQQWGRHRRVVPSIKPGSSAVRRGESGQARSYHKNAFHAYVPRRPLVWTATLPLQSTCMGGAAGGFMMIMGGWAAVAS
eukprot:scaffold3722_cov263-Pinguiococcus_pyrenoidosus.AAC.5